MQLHENSISPLEPPSARKLAVASLIALIGAAVILLVAVLPVEYGIDPLGTGKAFGLLRASSDDTPAVAAAGDAGEAGLVPTRAGDVAHYGGAYRADTIDLVLDPYDYLEYKYYLIADAQMVFSWSANAKLNHEFHGEPDENPKDVRSYDKSEKQSANGSFTAPVTGIHGWFWENTGNTPVTIHLSSAGFYSHAVEFRSNKTRKVHYLEPAQTAQKP